MQTMIVTYLALLRALGRRGPALEALGAPNFSLFMAGFTAPPLRSLDVDAWERFLDVNLKGPIYCLAPVGEDEL